MAGFRLQIVFKGQGSLCVWSMWPKGWEVEPFVVPSSIGTLSAFLVWEEPYSYYLAGSCSSLPSAGPG